MDAAGSGHGRAWTERQGRKTPEAPNSIYIYIYIYTYIYIPCTLNFESFGPMARGEGPEFL